MTDTGSLTATGLLLNMAATATPSHKNKTVATLLALLTGTLGGHRFYLGGALDRWALLHLTALPLAMLIAVAWPGLDWYFKMLPLVLSFLSACIEALVLGLMPDDKWDASVNPHSGRGSDSRWLLVLTLIATLMLGAGVLIAAIARLFDLLYTGGSYG